jgi:hypothetical protein
VRGLREKSVVVGIDIEILYILGVVDILGVNDKVREGEGTEKQAMVVGINIEIRYILGVSDKVREGESAEKQAMAVGIDICGDPGHPWS